MYFLLNLFEQNYTKPRMLALRDNNSGFLDAADAYSSRFLCIFLKNLYFSLNLVEKNHTKPRRLALQYYNFVLLCIRDIPPFSMYFFPDWL